MQYQIGDFSRISRLSIKTLRYYHECGLLEPEHIEQDSGYRYYDMRSLERVRIINGLKELDFSLKDIRDILDKCRDDKELLSHMVEKQMEVSQKIAGYKEMQRKIDLFIQQAKQSGEPEMNAIGESSGKIVTKRVPELIIASIRFKGRYQDVGIYIKRIYKACGRYVCGPAFSLYYDNEYRDEDADIEICLPLKKPVNGEDVSCKVLKDAKVLSAIHQGTYETIGDTYRLLFDYINTNCVRILSPSREIYLKGPGFILPGNPKKYLTEIQLKVCNI